MLLSGGRAATIAGPGQPWTLLPPVPAKTVLLAAGPDGATDALAAVVEDTVTKQAELFRQYDGFAEPVTTKDDATAFQKALALSGRDPAWKPAS